MIEFFFKFSFLSTAIAALATVVLCIGIAVQASYITESDGMQIIKTQINTCKTTSLLFCILAWIVASSMERMACLQYYSRIGEVCLYLGYAWIGLGFIMIIFCIFFGIAKRSKTSIAQIYRVRNSCFITGSIFLLLSMLLAIS